MTLPSHPGIGTGTPHFRSRVMQRDSRPLSSHPRDSADALADQKPALDRCSTSSRSCGSSSPSLMNRCDDGFGVGAVPQSLQRGLMSSNGSSGFVHCGSAGVQVARAHFVALIAASVLRRQLAFAIRSPAHRSHIWGRCPPQSGRPGSCAVSGAIDSSGAPLVGLAVELHRRLLFQVAVVVDALERVLANPAGVSYRSSPARRTGSVLETRCGQSGRS